MVTLVCEFHSNLICHNYLLNYMSVTRSTHLFSAKGIFCLYKEGMLLGANGKSWVKELVSAP